MNCDTSTPVSQETTSAEQPVVQDASTSESQHNEEPWEPTEQQQALIDEAEVIKTEGNTLFTSGSYQDAIDKYNDAIQTAPEQAPQQAVYFANIAACHVKLGNHHDAIKACTEALAVDPAYVKALARRSAAYEATNELERALADAKQVRFCVSPILGRLRHLPHVQDSALCCQPTGQVQAAGARQLRPTTPPAPSTPLHHCITHPPWPPSITVLIMRLRTHPATAHPIWQHPCSTLQHPTSPDQPLPPPPSSLPAGAAAGPRQRVGQPGRAPPGPAGGGPARGPARGDGGQAEGAGQRAAGQVWPQPGQLQG